MLSSYIHAKRPNSWRHFRAFAEHVEAAIAIGNILCNPATPGVVGAQGAAKLAREENDPTPLVALVQQPVVDIYFNPSLQLRFLLPGDEVPGLSKERGEPLAELVRFELSKTRLGKDVSAAKDLSEASRDSLREFGQAAALHFVTTEESELLIAGIIPIEAETEAEATRIRTYACLLGLAEALLRSPSEDDFFEEAQRLHRVLPTDLHPQLDSWLRHLVRDALAVGHEYLLEEVLHSLAELSHGSLAVPGAEVIESLIADANIQNETLRSYGLLSAEEGFQDVSFSELFARIELLTAKDRITERGLRRWSSDLSELKIIASIRQTPATALALLPIIWCVAVLRAEEWQESDVNAFEGRAGFGWNLIGVHAVVIPEVRRFIEERWQLPRVMAELAMRTVDQHLRVSWSRMAVDSRHDVALLIADGDQWQSRTEKHVQDFRAGRTNSRISQVINWLHQLRLVNESGPTQRGSKLYRELCEVFTAERVRH
jgi:hypothetical protein